MGSELCAPPDVENDPNALEILRIWVADGVLQLSVDISVYESVDDYGVMLAGLGNHFINAMTIGTGVKRNDALAVVLKEIAQKYKSVEDSQVEFCKEDEQSPDNEQIDSEDTKLKSTSKDSKSN